MDPSSLTSTPTIDGRRLNFGAQGRSPAPIAASTTDSIKVTSGDPAVLELFGSGSGRGAGVLVTAQTAMRMSTVWRCVTLISGANMSLPLVVYKRTGKEGRERADDHPYARLLQDEPNDDMSAAEMIELASIEVLLRGNGFGLIRQARNGTVTGIDFYPRHRARAWRSQGTVWYAFTNLDGSEETAHASYVIHFRGPGRDADGIFALSPIAYHAQTIGIGLATRDYTAGQFERGLLTNDYISFDKDVKTDRTQRDELREYLRKRNQGVGNAHNPMILPAGGEWKRLSISAKDAQLLELLSYSAVDVARIFGCPPHMIGEVDKSSSWGTGIEQQSIGFVTYTLRPHLRRFAKELNRRLFAPVSGKRSEFFAEFDVDGLLQGDAKARGEFYRIALGGNQLPGFMTQNEVRRRQNLPPLPGGDDLYVPTGNAPPGQPLVEPEKEPNDAS